MSFHGITLPPNTQYLYYLTYNSDGNNMRLTSVLLHIGNESKMDKATKSVTNSDIVSISKKITMLEMKELNERQRAEHCQKMYEHIRTSLKQMEERNFELETKFAEV
jgi:centrosomal protein CEP290